MKRLIFLVLILLIPSISFGGDIYEVKGYTPIAPYGVFSTFSAKSLQQGQLAIGPSFELLSESDLKRLSLQAAYGIKDNIEIGINIPYVITDAEEGLEDLGAGIKYRFIDEGRYGPSVAALFTATIPSGRHTYSTNSTDVGMGMLISKRVGPFNGNVNLIYTRVGKSGLKNELLYTIGVEFAAARNLQLLGELYGKKSRFSSDNNSLEARFGYRILTGNSVYTTIGLGFDLRNKNPEYRAMLSISFIYPPEKKKVIRIIEEGNR